MLLDREIKIRPAEPKDIEGIAIVHVESWKTTYRGLVADEFLDGLSVEGRKRSWIQLFNTPGLSDGVVVAETADGRIVGFAHGGPNRENVLCYDGELYAIYLLKEYQRLGIGTQLFEAVVNYLLDCGHRSLMVWVLKGNPALYFYLRMGGTWLKEQKLKVGCEHLDEIALGWKPLTLGTRP